MVGLQFLQKPNHNRKKEREREKEGGGTYRLKEFLRVISTDCNERTLFGRWFTKMGEKMYETKGKIWNLLDCWSIIFLNFVSPPHLLRHAYMFLLVEHDGRAECSAGVWIWVFRSTRAWKSRVWRTCLIRSLVIYQACAQLLTWGRWRQRQGLVLVLEKLKIWLEQQGTSRGAGLLNPRSTETLQRKTKYSRPLSWFKMVLL